MPDAGQSRDPQRQQGIDDNHRLHRPSDRHDGVIVKDVADKQEGPQDIPVPGALAGRIDHDRQVVERQYPRHPPDQMRAHAHPAGPGDLGMDRHADQDGGGHEDQVHAHGLKEDAHGVGQAVDHLRQAGRVGIGDNADDHVEHDDLKDAKRPHQINQVALPIGHRGFLRRSILTAFALGRPVAVKRGAALFRCQIRSMAVGWRQKTPIPTCQPWIARAKWLRFD
jgi:hypothetical protein